MIHRHGVPHKIRYDWRGAFIWLLQIVVIMMIVGWVK